MVRDILTETATIKRLTADLIDETAFHFTFGGLDRNPQTTPFRVQIELKNTNINDPENFTLCTITGSTEEYIACMNGINTGKKDFTSISNIQFQTPPIPSSGTLVVRAVNALGELIRAEKIVAENEPVRFYEKNGNIFVGGTGDELHGKYKVMIDTSTVIKNNDTIHMTIPYAGMTIGQLDFVKVIFDFEGLTHHTEAVLKPLE